ncbi:MAG TPA: hypothetical protein VMT53_03285, partial [Terriglobales bacterium]|nr:hypothetical protein [Terriglobales bacterium]
TDTHFAKRNRMGRSLTFLARIVQDGWSPDPREIAVDESSAVLVEQDGKSQIVGKGKGAYLISVNHKPTTCRANTPLTLENVAVYNAASGTTFDLKSWTGSGGKSYSLRVIKGSVTSTQAGNGIY